MTITTHPDFKSLDPYITDAEGISRRIRKALRYQYLFDRKTTPWEFCPSKLRGINVNVEKIDRLYRIRKLRRRRGSIYELICRMDYKGVPLYVALHARGNFSSQCGGLIFVTRDASTFTRAIFFPPQAMYKSLAEDDINVNHHHHHHHTECCRPPTLSYLCHETVCLNIKEERYMSVLPKLLIESLAIFRKMNVAIDTYRKPVMIWFI